MQAQRLVRTTEMMRPHCSEQLEMTHIDRSSRYRARPVTLVDHRRATCRKRNPILWARTPRNSVRRRKPNPTRPTRKHSRSRCAPSNPIWNSKRSNFEKNFKSCRRKPRAWARRSCIRSDKRARTCTNRPARCPTRKRPSAQKSESKRSVGRVAVARKTVCNKRSR